MEKLGQPHQEVRANGGNGGPRWDLIVVDTPPSRSALDFLDAPKRLRSFLDGRFIRLISAPARPAAAPCSRSSTWGSAWSPRRCRASSARCSATCRPSWEHWTRCSGVPAAGRPDVCVAGPAFDGLRRRRRARARRPAGGVLLHRAAGVGADAATGLVLNRVQQVQAAGLSAARASGRRGRADDGDHLTSGLLALHADLAGAADRQRRLARRFSVGHPNTPWRKYRRSPRTSTTSTGCGRSARHSRRARPHTRGGRPRRRSRPRPRSRRAVWNRFHHDETLG